MPSHQNGYVSERLLWDRDQAMPQTRNNQKGRCQRRCSISGSGLMTGSISLRRGYMLKWMTKPSLLCQHFGVLFVKSMKADVVEPTINNMSLVMTLLC